MQQSTCRRASCAVVVVLRAAAGSSGASLIYFKSYKDYYKYSGDSINKSR